METTLYKCHASNVLIILHLNVSKTTTQYSGFYQLIFFSILDSLDKKYKVFISNTYINVIENIF